MSWIVVAILLLCAAFFAISETALASVSRNRMKLFADRGDSRAKKALNLLNNFESTISTLLVCTNITHLSMATIVTTTVTKRWGVGAVPLSTIITTIVCYFAGEMLPKSIAKKRSEEFALMCAGTISFLAVVFKPVAGLLSVIGEAFASASKGEAEVSVTEDELYDIIEDMVEEGSIDETQEDIISSTIQFSGQTVDSILTPRVQVVAINIADPPEKVLEMVKSQTHSRLPVYEGSIDNIIGMLQIRNYLNEYVKTGRLPAIRPLLSKVYYAPENAQLDDLLESMSRNKTTMAIITDRFGGTLGIVSIEDILEEIVGEIADEEDYLRERARKVKEKKDAEKNAARTYLVEPKNEEAEVTQQ